MPADYFIDTNIFVYDLVASDPHKQEIAESLIRSALATGRGCISYQVVNECLNVALRLGEPALPSSAARRYLANILEPLVTVPSTAGLYHRALDIHMRYQFHFYDALIVAGAIAAGCSTLYSEDLQNGQRIEDLVITNPFL